jgi:type II secretory pathway component PulM
MQIAGPRGALEMDALREIWRAREPRERLVIGAGLALLTLAATWAYVWEPLTADRDRLVGALPRLRAQAALVAEQAAEAEHLRNAARTRGVAAAPETAIADLARTSGVPDAATAVTVLADGRVQVSLRAVPFDAFARLLGQLSAMHGYTVESVTLRATPDPGRVQVETLVLRAARAG